MDDNLEQAQKKADECQTDLTFELDSYTLSRIRPSASGLSRFLATNRKAFHRNQMRLIVNDYFNKEECDEPTMPLSQQAAFPSQTLARTLAEYNELLKKKTEECKAALIHELKTYIQSQFRSSTTGRSAKFYANLQSFHREQMLIIIDEFFNTEEDDLPTFPSSTTVHSVNQLEVTSNREAASDLVDTTQASQSISPVTSGDQQQLANSGEAQVKEGPIEEDSSVRPREGNPSTNENMANVSTNEQHQSDIEADSDCGCDDCMADKGRVQANPVMISPECDHSDAVANEELSTAGHVNEVTNNQEIDEDINSLLNQEKDQVEEEAVSQIQTYAQQQAPVPISFNSNNEQQVDNSVNSNFEINDSPNDSTEAANEQESQAMMINEEEANLEEDPNGPIIIIVQYSSPLSSPSNGDQSIHSFEDGDEDLEVEESIAQMQTDTPQQASVPTAVNSNNEQVDSNFENLNESQAMNLNDEDFNDEEAVDEQSDSQALFDEAFVDEPFPTVNFVSLPSTSTGRRLTRSQKRVIYVEPEEDLIDEYLTVNRNGKRTIPLAGKLSPSKRVTVEPEVVDDEEEEDEEDEEDEVGVEAATPLTVIVHHLNCTEAGCTEECKDKAQLIGHLLSKHQIREFRCKVKDCGLSFALKSELTDHHKSAHRNLKDWPCAQCEATCKSYHELSTHFWHYHEEGEFHCSADECDFTGKNRRQVYSHLRNHSSVKYECTFANCTASFRDNHGLAAHLRIHNQERPFACEECHKAFTTKHHLTVHKRIHSGLKPYICKWPGCDFSSSHRSNANTHVRMVHFGLPVTKKEQTERRIIDTRDAREFVEKIPTN